MPQFLLNHFGCDAKRINIFDTAKSNVRYNQLIKNVCSQNYFYDKDNSIENFINKNIETPDSTIIDEIVNGNFKVINQNPLTLYRFILSLFCRTPEASERVSGFVNSHLESVLRELFSLNGLDPEEACRGRLNFHPDRLASLLTLQGFVDAEMLLIDLDYHIIKNETQLEFYISDHPVFIYNWLYQNLEHPGVTSLTATGLQIFLPLSPKMTLCLYDPKVYKYGQRNSVISYANDSDIEILNSFQIINSKSIIGFYSRGSEVNLKQLYEKYKGFRLPQYKSDILSTTKEGRAKTRSTHFIFTQQTKLKKMPSFIKIKDKYKGYAYSFQQRNPDLSASHMDFKRFINEQGQRSILELDQN